MEQQKGFIEYIEQSIKSNWDLNALTDYKGATLQYKDVARKIAKFHIILEQAGIEKGDKIAICGRNSANWAVTFLGVVTYGAVAVPILHEFKADNIHHIVNHSEAKLLFVGDQVWENLNDEAMPMLKGIASLNDFSVLLAKDDKLVYAAEHRNEIYGTRYPRNFRPEHIEYHKPSLDELVIINYTSGTTGYSKGVMLSCRSIWSNIHFWYEMRPVQPGDTMVSMLPMGHVFGMTLDFLYGFSCGAHLYFLTRMPSPKIIAQSFAEIKPKLIATVPLIVEKIIKKDVLPRVDSKIGKLLLKVPILSDKILTDARKTAMEIFGGNFEDITIGGAPLNAEIESFLRKINFPYNLSYGMTECGPLICSSHWYDMKKGSCGRAVARMQVNVLSDNPASVPGELVCKGDNMMIGYYKNQEATEQVVDKDGWLHTGDMATMDSEGNITIIGRCKNMLLNSSGQNIYPEEIEGKLNNMPYISESLIVMQNDKLVALIFPDFDEAFANGIKTADLGQLFESSRKELNSQLPAYSQISKIKIHYEEFEKTAKKSIKRFMYQNMKD
jgi:long-chain acyl-CoA synthetase